MSEENKELKAVHVYQDEEGKLRVSFDGGPTYLEAIVLLEMGSELIKGKMLEKGRVITSARGPGLVGVRGN